MAQLQPTATIEAWDSLIPGSIVPLKSRQSRYQSRLASHARPGPLGIPIFKRGLARRAGGSRTHLRQSGHGRGKKRAYHRRTAGRVDLLSARIRRPTPLHPCCAEQKHPPAQQQPEPDSHHRARGSRNTTGHYPDHQRRHCIGHERARPGQQHRDPRHSHHRSDPAAQLPPAGHQVDLGGHGRPSRSNSQRPRRSSVTSEVQLATTSEVFCDLRDPTRNDLGGLL